MSALEGLSRRERQIMEILFQRGKASAAEVREAMTDAPGYSAVRAMLRILEEKGHVKHQAEGLKYVYVPSIGPRQGQAHRGEASDGDIFQRLARARNGRPAGRFFTQLSSEELDRMAQLIESARKEGK